MTGNKDLAAIEMIAASHYWQAVEPLGWWRRYVRESEIIEIEANEDDGVLAAAYYRNSGLVADVPYGDWTGDMSKWHTVTLWIASNPPSAQLDNVHTACSTQPPDPACAEATADPEPPRPTFGRSATGADT